MTDLTHWLGCVRDKIPQNAIEPMVLFAQWTTSQGSCAACLTGDLGASVSFFHLTVSTAGNVADFRAVRCRAGSFSIKETNIA